MEVEELLVREEIRDTIARYAFAADRGHFGEVAACFCPDGILEVRGAWKATGRREIADRLGSLPSSPGVPTSLVRHHLTSHRAELDSPGTARSWTYFFVVTAQGPDHAGRYVDRFRRSGDFWLLEHRSVALDWRSTPAGSNR